MSPRVSIDDLEAARDWLREYNDGSIYSWANVGPGTEVEEDETAKAMFKVADWIDAEIKRRMEDQVVRRTARERGFPTPMFRKALRRQMRQRQETES